MFLLLALLVRMLVCGLDGIVRSYLCFGSPVRGCEIMENELTLNSTGKKAGARKLPEIVLNAK